MSNDLSEKLPDQEPMSEAERKAAIKAEVDNVKKRFSQISEIDTIESLKSQLAEAQWIIEHKEKEIKRQIEVVLERDTALKANHVTLDLIRSFSSAVERLAFSIPAPNVYTPKFIQLTVDAQNALSTPKIEGLVVCKDEPIYQVFDPLNGFVEADKDEFDQTDIDDKRIVYEKAGK